MKEDFNDIEFVSRKTKRGLLLLVFLCLLIIYIPRFLSFFRTPEDIALSQVEMEKARELVAFYNKEQKAKKKSFSKREYRRPPRKFNPNDYSQEEWMYLGLSEKQAAVMLKIAKKGIWTNEFLGRITVLPDEVYTLIKDSTIFPAREYPKKEYNKDYKTDFVKKEREILIVELNGATEEEMVSIYGVGPYFAKKIIAYRDLLGGFTKKEQLLEVYNFGIEKYESINAYVTVDPKKIQKMNINTISLEQLKAHPYISFSIANSIVKYRDQHGDYIRIEDLKKSQLITQELFDKLKPYVYLQPYDSK
jgi:competence ComEA-like helix-hairpin-helix protein